MTVSDRQADRLTVRRLQSALEEKRRYCQSNFRLSIEAGMRDFWRGKISAYSEVLDYLERMRRTK